MPIIEAYDPDFLCGQEAEALFRRLSEDGGVVWLQEQFQIFGRKQSVPRLTAWFGDEGINYRYTGLDHQGLGWPDYLGDLRDRISSTFSASFNFVILNRYRQGADYMGWHRDAEKGAEAQIASLSLGGVRTFRIQLEQDDRPKSIDLAHGSLLLFDGFNRHQLPKRKNQIGERINLTFRNIYAGNELSNT
jgi:alkylated DNA repair dioxygenase AlkB